MAADDLPPPFHSIPGIANLRDVGGIPIAKDAGKAIRSGVFYRSADPCKCPASSISILRDSLGIAEIFDLRSKPELDRNADTEGDVPAWDRRLADAGGIKRSWTPVFREEDYSPEQVALRFKDYASDDGVEGFVRAYSSIAKYGAPTFGRVLRHIAAQDGQNKQKAILIHCSAGKDRTGVLTAVLLSLLGVSDEAVAKEYTLTEVGLASQKPLFIERLMTTPAFQDPNGPGRDGAVRMTTCTDEKMLATLDMFRREYGGAEGYVKSQCGLSDADLQRIRRVMTVDKQQGASSAL